MKILIVEDDIISQIIMEEIMSLYGECDIAKNGKDGVEAFKRALIQGKPYDLICMDIVMPEMDGHLALSEIREHEEYLDIDGHQAVKVVMISSLNDIMNIKKAFIENCESYIIKPIEKKKVCGVLERMGFVEQMI